MKNKGWGAWNPTTKHLGEGDPEPTTYTHVALARQTWEGLEVRPEATAVLVLVDPWCALVIQSKQMQGVRTSHESR